MNDRQRFINTMMFKPVDRVPLVEWGIREATMNAWLKQGYPKGMSSQ